MRTKLALLMSLTAGGLLLATPLPAGAEDPNAAVVLSTGCAGCPYAGPFKVAPWHLQAGQHPGKKQKVTYIGVSITDVSDALRKHFKLPSGMAVMVAHVMPDSPAAPCSRSAPKMPPPWQRWSQASATSWLVRSRR